MLFYGRVISWLVTASTVVGAVALVIMMVQIVADVLLKNLFGYPIPTTSVLVANYYMVAIAYLPIALCEKLDRHISVEVVFQYFSKRFSHWLLCFIWLASTIVASGITWKLWSEAVRKYEVSAFVVEQSYSVPVWPGTFTLPFGFGLFALVASYRFLIGVTGLASGLGEVVVVSENSKRGEQDLPVKHSVD